MPVLHAHNHVIIQALWGQIGEELLAIARNLLVVEDQEVPTFVVFGIAHHITTRDDTSHLRTLSVSNIYVERERWNRGALRVVTAPLPTVLSAALPDRPPLQIHLS